MGQLYDKLTEYSKSDNYPFHMPGHKRQGDMGNVFDIDITEIDGFDNMHNPEDIIKSVLDEISAFYESDRTYFLVNGSTGGILAAISSVVKKGGKILVARNCHKSVYNAIYLNELMPVYVYPDMVFDGKSKANIINGGISPMVIEENLRSDNGLQAVVITSPTYEGIVSDVKEIANICHKYNVPLIVDEAHGAHFDMHDYFPKSALSMGADIVVQSLHKTLPSMTQTGLLHVKSKLVEKKNLEKFLSIYQTSSPSYVFMSSIERCLDEIMKYGDLYFEKYVEMVESFRKDCRKFTHIKLLDSRIKGSGNIFDMDRTRIVIFSVGGKLTGKELYNRLVYRYHIQMEMAAPGYVIAITSVKDTKEGFSRLFDALTEIDREMRIGKNLSKATKAYALENYGGKSKAYSANSVRGEESPEVRATDSEKDETKLIEEYSDIKAVVYDRISEIDNKETEYIGLANAVGKISADFVYIYPPGIPMVAPGEMINKSMVAVIENYLDCGFNVNGLTFEKTAVAVKRPKNPQVRVVKEDFKKVSMTEIFGRKVFAQI